MKKTLRILISIIGFPILFLVGLLFCGFSIAVIGILEAVDDNPDWESFWTYHVEIISEPWRIINEFIS